MPLESIEPADLSRAGAALPESLRILHVLDHSLPIHSGYSFRTLAILRQQRQRGWHTAQLTTPKHIAAGPLSETISGFEFHRTPARMKRLLGVPALGELALINAVARRIEQLAAADGPDILHAHSPVLNALACLIAARRLMLPVVYEVRSFWEDAAVSHGTSSAGGLRYRASRALESFALKRVDGIAPICAGLYDDIVARGIPAERVEIIANGVDVEEFPFEPMPEQGLRSAHGLENRVVLGFLGSFYGYEGLDLLLSALPEVVRRHAGVTVLLVGGGPEEAALKAQAQRLALGDAVRFVGRVPHEIIQQYYRLVDIFVYPRHRLRLTDTTTPLKPLEAMARGGIVLASDVGGHRELVRDRDTGHLFPPDDADELARAIVRLIEGRNGWAPMRHRARQFVEAERTWSVTTQRYGSLYAQALRGRQSR